MFQKLVQSRCTPFPVISLHRSFGRLNNSNSGLIRIYNLVMSFYTIKSQVLILMHQRFQLIHCCFPMQSDAPFGHRKWRYSWQVSTSFSVANKAKIIGAPTSPIAVPHLNPAQQTTIPIDIWLGGTMSMIQQKMTAFLNDLLEVS